MTLPLEQPRFTIEQYVRSEDAAIEKHEFHDGEILAMSGGTPAHSLIAANCLRELGNALKGKPCRADDANLRVRVRRTRRYVYPAATVVCGAASADPEDFTGQSILNPRVVLEVLSPSTESYDRQEKFDHYRMIDTLESYVLVNQREPRVEVFTRLENRWVFDTFVGIEATARLDNLKVAIPLAEIYSGVDFAAPPGNPGPTPETPPT